MKSALLGFLDAVKRYRGRFLAVACAMFAVAGVDIFRHGRCAFTSTPLAAAKTAAWCWRRALRDFCCCCCCAPA